MRNFIFILLVIVIGCSKPRFITKTEDIVIVPKDIEKELTADLIKDTIIQANEIIKQDTLTVVKYFPKIKKFYLKAKPDTIKITRLDTLTITETIEKIEYKTNAYLLLFAFVSGLIVTIIIRRLK